MLLFFLSVPSALRDIYVCAVLGVESRALCVLSTLLYH